MVHYRYFVTIYLILGKYIPGFIQIATLTYAACDHSKFPICILGLSIVLEPIWHMVAISLLAMVQPLEKICRD